MNTFKDDFEAFLERPEVGQPFGRAKWKLPIPYLEEIDEIKGPLLREHVFDAARHSDRKGIVYALVWGYPNGYTDFMSSAAKRNLQTVLAHDLDELAETVGVLRDYSETATKTIRRLNKTKGIGTASTSKIAFFTGLKPAEGQCLIFDRQVIRAILLYPYPELDDLRAELVSGLKPGKAGEELVGAIINSEANYGRYLHGMTQLAKHLGPIYLEDLERFLFTMSRRRFETEDPTGNDTSGVPANS